MDKLQTAHNRDDQDPGEELDSRTAKSAHKRPGYNRLTTGRKTVNDVKTRAWDGGFRVELPDMIGGYAQSCHSVD